MRILLLRHGIAEDAPPGHTDSERALTADGKVKLRRVLERARDSGLEPSLILSSPLRRARETAAAAAEVFKYAGKVGLTRALEPNASPHDLWEELRAHSDEPAIMVASHEPLMSSMAAFLLASPGLQIDMKKAALVRIDCAGLGPQPKGVLKWMLTPAVSDGD